MVRLSLFICSTALLFSNSFTVASQDGISHDEVAVHQAIPHLPGQHVLEHEYKSEADGEVQLGATKPFYVIAHRVLMAQSVKDALSNGANAVEIDMYAWKDGWYADHDGSPSSSGDTARKMFETIAAERKAGKTITFVWLDIKNPSWCDASDPVWRHCSIDGLRDLARELLEPEGIRVLYGFYHTLVPRSILDTLNSYEAINLNGLADEVQQGFDSQGPASLSQRVMSYGYYNLAGGFSKTSRELAKGVASKKFGKVFGWTSSSGQSWYVDKLLGEAGVDGLIYGFQKTYYYDHDSTRAAAQDIISWIRDHSSTHHVATQEDKPW